MKVLVEQPGYLFIPKWQFNAISKKVIIKDRILYKELRSILSILDIAELIALNNLQINGLTLGSSNNGLNDFLIQPTETELIEYEHTILPIADMASTLKNIQARLQLPIDSNEKPFSFVVLPSMLIIIIDDGFLTYLKDSRKDLIFVQDVLKSLYKIASIAAVAKTGLFYRYLRLLSLNK